MDKATAALPRALADAGRRDGGGAAAAGAWPGHFGPELRRFVLVQYHQSQCTVERTTWLLQDIGIDISKRQVQRLLTDKQEGFLAEDRAVLEAGLATAAWISVDDTGARHADRNATCTRIGDARSVRYLVWRLEAYGGGGARGFSFFGNQLTYIQDFDVEVAQTAFIADPVVGTIQEGIVLDAQVVGTQQISEWVEREVYYGALAKLTGETDVKKDTASWVAWWREHGEDFEKKALAAK